MIQQYLEGKLDPEVMHQLEKQALEDPFLWDALEGYAEYKDPAANLSILQRQLHERIVHLQENKKVFDLSWQRLSIAAAAAVMFISAGILFWMNSSKPNDKLASESNKQVEVNVIDRDSVEAVIKAADQNEIAAVNKGQSTTEQPGVSAYKPRGLQGKKTVISPETESQAPKQQDIPDTALMARTMSSATASVSARRSETAEVSGALNKARVGYTVQPKTGWEAYGQYVSLNAGKFKSEPVLKGTVLLSFDISPSGKPSNIKVIRGLNDAYNKEAIRIVEKGPDWLSPPEGKKIEQRIEIKFGP